MSAEQLGANEVHDEARMFGDRIYEHMHKVLNNPELEQVFYGTLGVVRTQLERGGRLGRAPVWIKDERRQPSGSYKTRGASMGALLTHADALTTFSTGNHGRSLAIAGRLLGKRVVVQGVQGMSAAKRNAIEATGVELVLHKTFDEAEEAARACRMQLIAPFGDEQVVMGQCTLGKELVQDMALNGFKRRPSTIVAPIAGGGLMSGIAISVERAKRRGYLHPGTQVIGVQPEGADTMNRALRAQAAGMPVKNLYGPGGVPDPRCDAVAIGERSMHPDMLRIIGDKRFVAGIVTVSAAETGVAMREMEARYGGAVEPAAALPFAVIQRYAEHQPLGTEPFIMPITGANVSDATREAYAQAVLTAPPAQQQNLNAPDKNASTRRLPGRSGLRVAGGPRFR